MTIQTRVHAEKKRSNAGKYGSSTARRRRTGRASPPVKLPARARVKVPPPMEELFSPMKSRVMPSVHSNTNPSDEWDNPMGIECLNSHDETPFFHFDEPELESDYNLTHVKADQHHYMNDWILRKQRYAHAILSREALSDNGVCKRCRTENGSWRCSDCLGQRAVCRQCCLDIHKNLPFHRIEYWNMTHYEVDTLYNIGLVIYLGHDGDPCPLLQNVGLTTRLTESPLPEESPYMSPSQKRWAPVDSRTVTIGHTNGFHRVSIRSCGCDHDADESHLLQLGLYPLSFKHIESSFTFELLDDVLHDNLELKASTYHYHKKLQQMTSPLFPASVASRYQELYRVSRQWRHLKNMKWDGSLYGAKAAPGSSGLFCAACPQPGINVPTEWKLDPDQLPYSRSFVMDGNFSAVHQRRQNALYEQCLNDGNLFMVAEGAHSIHRAMAREYKDPDTCNEHHAVNDKFLKHKGQDVTGIGATACARHGAFCPSGVVNFQRGERQVDMDYSLCNGLANSNIGDLTILIILYDIMCQYHRNLPRRLADSPQLLPFPPGKKVYFGVGAFHISGHVPECFPRHSPHYIPGAGVVDGERCESLWATLNQVSPSVQVASLAARTELLDDHMLDSNWKKMLDIGTVWGHPRLHLSTDVTPSVPSTIKRFEKALKGSVDSEAYLVALEETLPEKSISTWEADMLNALEGRLSEAKAMDVFDTTLTKGPTCAEKQLELMKDESRRPHLKGCATWISDGLELQQAQLLLAAEIGNMKRKRSPDEEVSIHRKRHALDERIEKNHNEAEKYMTAAALDALPEGIEDELGLDPDPDIATLCKGANVEQDPVQLTFVEALRVSQLAVLAEKKTIWLPSSIGLEKCIELKLADLVAIERALREGQANDALHDIRILIAEKSFAFRKKLRHSKSKVDKTRSWDAIHTTDKRLTAKRLIYRQARIALLKLGAPADMMDRSYRELSVEDCQVSKAISEPNARGERNSKLSWIWTTPAGQSSCNEESLLDEMYRVNWLRARSGRDRWREELSITQHEMVWIILWFQHRAKLWSERGVAQSGASDPSLGLVAYAHRQAANWTKLAEAALRQFSKVNGMLHLVFGYSAIDK